MRKIFILSIVAFGISACTTKTTQESTTYCVIEKVYAEPIVLEEDISSYVPSDEFSVSLDTKIKFSLGNLQYRASTDTWRFAENQYDVLGEYNAEISAFNEGWIDLLGWGTGDNPTISNLDFSHYVNFSDWGENTISNGENNVTWRTLTRDEWLYLFRDRENAGYRFGWGCVNDVNGIIILPDKWRTPDNLIFTSSIECGARWEYYFDKKDADGFADYNYFSVAEWVLMEKNGAIFLPAAGYRYNGKSILEVGEVGCYWSSTPADGFECYGAYPMRFNSKTLYVGEESSYEQRHEGLSVRLVHDLK